MQDDECFEDMPEDEPPVESPSLSPTPGRVRRLNGERAARILVEASLFGDAPTCEKYGISRRTLFRYRLRLQHDAQLSHSVTEKNRILSDRWGQEANDAMVSALKRLREIVERADVEQLRDVAQVVKVLGDLLITRDAIMADEHEAGVSR